MCGDHPLCAYAHMVIPQPRGSRMWAILEVLEVVDLRVWGSEDPDLRIQGSGHPQMDPRWTPFGTLSTLYWAHVVYLGTYADIPQCKPQIPKGCGEARLGITRYAHMRIW
jgi:hypothetical protein